MPDKMREGLAALCHEQLVGWTLAKEGETIPYEVALVGNRELTEDEIERGKELQSLALEYLDMYDKLKQEFEYYLVHQQELVEKYDGKYIVIKNQTVIGAFDQELEAIEETSKEHELGTFLVQKCEPGTESYTQIFHSRVVFT